MQLFTNFTCLHARFNLSILAWVAPNRCGRKGQATGLIKSVSSPPYAGMKHEGVNRIDPVNFYKGTVSKP